MRRAGAALLLGALSLGGVACAASQRSPTETVQRYLEWISSDPIRTLEITSDAFHARHGLRFSEVGDQPFREPAAASHEAPSTDRDLELTRARFGWLTALTKRVFALQAPRFHHELGPARIEGDVAEVPVRVEERGRPPLDAVFHLERAAPDAPWQIAAIELPEVADADLIRAFVLAPDAELNRRILAGRRRGR